MTSDFLATGGEAGADEESALLQAHVALRMDDAELAEGIYREAFETSGEARLRAEAAAGLGQLAFRRGEPRAAIGHFEQALSLYGSDETAHPALADSLGRAYAIVGENELAIAVFERCLGAAEQRADPIERTRFSVLLANALIDAGNFGRAEELLGAALADARSVEDPLTRARLIWSESRLHTLQGRPETAARHARRALAILELTEHDHYTARAHQLLAHIELDRGKPSEALDSLRHGLALLGESGNDYERAKFQLEEARALAQLGRSEEAAGLAMAAAGALAGTNPSEAGRGYGVIAEALEETGDSTRARELYELAAELLEREPSRYLAQVLSRLAELLEREGNRDEAYDVLKRAVRAQATSSHSGS